jgi:probable F420-dependent oxidoreductase
LASTCDRLGFDYYGVSDHVIVSAQIDSTYPYTEDGSWPGASDADCIDCLTTLSFVAANTKRVRLLTSVMVIPHRPAVLASQILATLDVLSKGRLTVGIGVGWMEEELVALGAPDYQRRGAASEEYINAYRTLWRDEVAAFDGEFVSFKNVIAAPKPVQQPGPPIWIGGEGPAARRRVARLGDGWYPACCNPRYPLDTVERFSAAVNDVRQRTEADGRNPDDIEIALFVPWAKLGEPIMKDGERMIFTGPRDALLKDVASFEKRGLDVLIPSLIAPSVEEIVDNCEAFAEAIGMG